MVLMLSRVRDMKSSTFLWEGTYSRGIGRVIWRLYISGKESSTFRAGEHSPAGEGKFRLHQLKRSPCIQICSEVHFAIFCLLSSSCYRYSIISHSRKVHYSPWKVYGSYICCHYHLLKGFRTAFEAIQDDVPGFELCVREEISRILFYIYRENEDVITKPQGERNHDTDRLRYDAELYLLKLQ